MTGTMTMTARALTAVVLVCCLAFGALPVGVALAGGDQTETAETETAVRAPSAPARPDAALAGGSHSVAGGDRNVADDGGGPFAQSDVPADDVSLHAAVAPNGTAHWTVTLRVTLDDENASRAFANVSERIRQSPGTWRSRFADRMRATAATAENATAREMAIRDVTVETSTQSGLGATDYGVVRYTFAWDGFAAREGDRLVVGDALAGLYLDANTSLTISWPDGYESISVVPTAPDAHTGQKVVWEGERDFLADEPRVVVEPAGPLSGLPVSTGAVAVAVLAVGVLAVGLAWRAGALDRFDGPGSSSGTDAESARAGATGEGGSGGTGAAGGTGATGRTHEAAGPGSTDATPNGAGPTGGEAGRAGDAARSTGDTAGAAIPGADVPEELLSNEERVLRALHEHDGRMKQQDLVEALGWTEAKTSQVVSGMRDEGTIEGFRLGRENVLSLSDDGGEGP